MTEAEELPPLDEQLPAKRLTPAALDDVDPASQRRPRLYHRPDPETSPKHRKETVSPRTSPKRDPRQIEIPAFALEEYHRVHAPPGPQKKPYLHKTKVRRIHAALPVPSHLRGPLSVIGEAADGKHAICRYRSYQDLAVACERTRRRMVDAVAELEALGLIRTRTRRNRHGNQLNLFELVIPEALSLAANDGAAATPSEVPPCELASPPIEERTAEAPQGVGGDLAGAREDVDERRRAVGALLAARAATASMTTAPTPGPAPVEPPKPAPSPADVAIIKDMIAALPELDARLSVDFPEFYWGIVDRPGPERHTLTEALIALEEMADKARRFPERILDGRAAGFLKGKLGRPSERVRALVRQRERAGSAALAIAPPRPVSGRYTNRPP